MKHILVTGADGFLGKNFVKNLSTDRHIVHRFQGDITNDTETEKFLRSIPEIDLTYHFAGISSPAVCLNDKSLATKINVDGAVSFAKSVAEKFPQSTFIFPSTGQVYESSLEGETLTENSAVKPVSFYAETKLTAENKLLEIKNLKTIVLRLFNHSHKSQDPHFFLPSLYRQISDGSTEVKSGNLNLIRDFGAIQDLIPALVLLTQMKIEKSDVYNMCSGTGKNLRKLATELGVQMKRNIQLKEDPNLIRQNEPQSIIGSSAKFQSAFGWSPTHARNEQDLISNFLKEF